MAPELWAGHPPTPASDVFAFGVLLHLLGTGVMPAPDDQRAAPGPAGVPPDLVALVHDCLAPDPLARPRDGRALVERLARIEAGAGSEGARGSASDVNPYLGIRPFDHEHSGLFFGRSSEIDEVVARLRQPRMVVITGESGVGKSSLARAGVLPRLRDRAWSEARVVPNPLGALAGLLASALAHRAPAAELEILIRNADWPGLARCWQASRPAGALVWFFDQLDDLLATETGPTAAGRWPMASTRSARTRPRRALADPTITR